MNVFFYQRKVFLRDTDATGVIYFGSMLQYSLEAFESFLHSSEYSLSYLLSLGYLFPVVHAEADYKAPIQAGDDLSFFLKVSKISDRSFTIETEITRSLDGACVGRTKMVHAFLLKGDAKSSVIPEKVVTLLSSIAE